MVRITTRDTEACSPRAQHLWDTVWVQEPITHLTAQGGFGDWDTYSANEPGNTGGLRSKATLHTATIICLFTDRRAPADVELDGDDPRGWWGDSVLFEGDKYERELGSHLWMLERGTLSEETALIAQEMAEDALAVLVEQGMVAETQVETEALVQEGKLLIGVRHFSHAGETSYEQRFDFLWGQNVRYAADQTMHPSRSY